MKCMILLTLGLTVLASAAEAQAPPPATPAPAVGYNGVGTGINVRRTTKVKRNARYSRGTPVVAGAVDGVRINGSGEVLYDEP